jgi:predicted phosphohydrolase
MTAKQLVALLLAAALVTGSVLSAILPLRFELLTPRLGVPAIRLPGESFEIELRTSLPGWSPAPEVVLVGDERVVCTARYLDSSGSRQALVAQIPGDAPAGSYTLEVALGDALEARTRAVHVLTEYPEELTVVQLADLPTFLKGKGGDEQMQRTIAEVNTIDPDLVLLTGDIAYGNKWENFRAAFGHFEDFEAPVVAAIGNHEYRGLAAFFTIFGPLNHVVDFGERRIVSANSAHGRDQLTESQYAWLADALDGPGAILQLHHPLFWQRNLASHVDDVVRLCDDAEVPVVLAGHWHGDYVFDRTGEPRADTPDFDGTKYVVTTAAGAKLRPETSATELHHGYRVLRFSGNRLVDYTYDWDGDGVRDPHCSIPIDRLRTEQVASGRAVVHNELNESFPDALVTVWVDGDARDLLPDRGAVEDTRVEGERVRYRVRVDLAANSTTSITLRRD